jgi:hypothetical protein
MAIMPHTGCPEGEHEQWKKLRLGDHLVVTRQGENLCDKRSIHYRGLLKHAIYMILPFPPVTQACLRISWAYLPRGTSTPRLYEIPVNTAKPRVSPNRVRRYFPYLPSISFPLALSQ